MTLARPDYCVRDKLGRMVELYCKVCGVQIGDDRAGAFLRFPKYGELKMQFSDGSKHVTNLCHDCIPIVADSRQLMMEVYYADLDDMARDAPPDIAPSVMLLKFKLAPKFVRAEMSRFGLP